MKIASAGTIESNDCLITVKKSEKLEIEIESIVFKQFGDEIYKVIKDTLMDLGIFALHVRIIDKGALNYTIAARLKTAILRLEDFK